MTEIEKISKQNKGFKLKLFISYIVFTILILSSIIIIHVYFTEGKSALKFEREVTLQSYEKKREFNNYFKNREDAIKAVSQNPYFLKYVDDGSYNYYVDLLLFTIMEANKEYMQIRFIDKNGHEKLRFDRDRESKEPYKSNILQDKSNRYYFHASKLLGKNKVWFSSIDLNIEHGVIEKPFRPVVRVATPLYIKNEFKGILILNIFMEELLRSLTKSSIYDIYLMDKFGYYFIHKDKKFNWSYYKDKHNILHDFDSKTVKTIMNNYNHDVIVTNKIFVEPLRLGNQQISMMLVEKDELVQDTINSNNKMIITILIFSTFVSLLFSIIFSKPLKNMYEIVVKQSSELSKLAATLEIKVKEETLKNAKKDRLLQHQSKLAELGDMIGNIAHQWRHPLTRLSLILQNLKAYNNKGKLNEKLLEESLENSLYQINFMSTTIDNFKDFYKNDKKKKEFYISDSLDSVLKIVGSILEHLNIDVKIENNSSMMIFGNKNEFSQVLMNLIMNAKDAFEERHINPAVLTIKIDDSEKGINISICDNAGGIKEEYLKEIFNPYFTTKDEKGTGIGLYLSKSIIEEKFHGKLRVINNENGVKFTIYI